MTTTDILPSQNNCTFKKLRSYNLCNTGLNCYIGENLADFIENQLYCGVINRSSLLTAIASNVYCLVYNTDRLTPSCDTSCSDNILSNNYLADNIPSMDDNYNSVPLNDLESWCDADLDNVPDNWCIPDTVNDTDNWCDPDTVNDPDTWCDPDAVNDQDTWCDSDPNPVHASGTSQNVDEDYEDWDAECEGESSGTSTWAWKPERRIKRSERQQQDADGIEVTEDREVPANNNQNYILVESHPRKLYISNINFRTPQYRLWQLMEDHFGDVQYCRILKDKRRRSKGRGFVMFKDIASIQKILSAEDNQLTLDKRVLRVEPAWRKQLVQDDDKKEENSQNRKDREKKAVVENWDGSLELSDSADNEGHDDNKSHGNKSHGNNSHGNNSHNQDTLDNINCNYSPCSTCSINDVNEYVLLNIFTYIPWHKRLSCERVCKKWRAVSRKLWQSTTDLSLYSVLPSFAIFSDKILYNLLKRGCPVLVSLDLSSVSRMLTCWSLESIGKHCPKLEKLDISGISSSNKGIKQLAEGCKNLQWIKLKDCHDIGDKGLWSLFVNCKQLRYVNLEGNRRITGKCFTVSQQHIETIILTDCVQITTEGITLLSDRWNTVQSLSLSGCPSLNDQGFTLIMERCTQIRVFEMTGHVEYISPAAYCKLGLLTHLEELNLSKNPSINDSVLTAVSKGCKQLGKLDIMLCWKEVTDEGIQSLGQCPKLEHLDISYLIKVTAASIEHIAINGGLKSLSARGCSAISEQGFLSVISLCPRLQLLDVCGCHQVTQNICGAMNVTTADYLSENQLELYVGGTSIDPDEVLDLPCYVKIHFHNLCVNRLRPDREIHIYMGEESSEEEEYEETYDVDDFLDYDDPLFEERFDMS